MKKHLFLLETIVFISILVLVIGKYYDAVRYKTTGNGAGVDNIYTQKVPIDVVAFGSSHSSCSLNNAQLWEDYGIASYALTAGTQNVDGTYYFMQEMFKHNKPKIALVETYVFYEDEFTRESLYRSALTPKWSLQYIPFVLKRAEFSGYDREFTEELVLRMPLVHDRYRELSRADFYNDMFYNKGFRGSEICNEIEKPVKTDAVNEMPEKCRYYIDKIVELCQKEGVQLIFFNAPYEASEEEVANQNGMRQYAEEHGIPYLGLMHNDEEYGIDYSKDFREHDHVNDIGAQKITTIIADYLLENYDLTDHRNEAGYEEWDLFARYIDDRHQMYALNSCTDLASYLDLIKQMSDRYDIVISFNGNYNAQGEEAIEPSLEPLGIDLDMYLEGGVILMENGEITYRSGGASNYNFHKELEHNTDLCLCKTDSDPYGHVYFNGVDYMKEYNGISIHVYDEQCIYLVDDMYVDVYEGLNVERTIDID